MKKDYKMLKGDIIINNLNNEMYQVVKSKIKGKDTIKIKSLDNEDLVEEVLLSDCTLDLSAILHCRKCGKCEETDEFGKFYAFSYVAEVPDKQGDLRDQYLCDCGSFCYKRLFKRKANGEY